MKEGKITKVVKERKFFFVDEVYWCHFNQYYGENPEVGDIVEYESEIKTDGKKNATKVRLIMKNLNEGEKTGNGDSTSISDYYTSLKSGYFDESNCLKEELIIEHPKILASYFSKDKDKNKSSQIRKFFDQCKLIESKHKISKNFDCNKTELLQILPLANNSKEKGHITNDFYKFLEININEAIKSENNFLKGFIPHFQSLIGYFKTN